VIIAGLLPGWGDAIPFAIGRNVTIHTNVMYHPAIVQLFDGEALLCFTCGSQTKFAICSVLSDSGATVSKGADTVINPAPSYYLALTKLSIDRVILCYRDSSSKNSAACNVIRVSGTQLTVGTKLVIDAGPLEHLALARLGDDQALFCYPQILEGSRGRCRTLGVAGLELTQGSAVAVGGGRMYHPALAPISENRAVLCYTDASAMSKGHCVLLTGAGGRPAESADTGVDAKPMYHPLVAQVGEGSAMVCYTDLSMSNYLTCNLLTDVGGTSLTTSDPLTVEGGFTFYPALSKLDSNVMLLCNPGSWLSDEGECEIITASGTKLSIIDHIPIHGGSMFQPVLARIRTNKAVLCYVGEEGFCNMIFDPTYV